MPSSPLLFFYHSGHLMMYTLSLNDVATTVKVVIGSNDETVSKEDSCLYKVLFTKMEIPTFKLDSLNIILKKRILSENW